MRALVRSRPRARPASAQRVRQLLERKLRVFPADGRLELASWLWETGVFHPREGDTVVISGTIPRARRRRLLWRGVAAAAAALTAALIASAVYVSGVSPQALAERARTALTRVDGSASRPARMRFEIDQRLKVAIDGGQAVAVEPGDERELAPGRHQLVFEWPSGAHADLALEAAPGEELRVHQRQECGPGRLTARAGGAAGCAGSPRSPRGCPAGVASTRTIFSDSTPPMCALS